MWQSFVPGRSRTLPIGTTSITADHLIDSKIKFDEKCPIQSGGYAHIFRGAHETFGNVALKRLKVDGVKPQNIALFESEVDTWRVLDHVHILPFIGTFFKGGHLYIISPWAENGALPDYLKSHPDADRLKYIIEIADALTYLHTEGYIHGDIKAQNILVACDGRSQLCDFGVSRAVSALTLSGLKGTGSLPWRSPELWDDESKTLESDVYAFGMTIYEVLSGNTPFHDVKGVTALAGAVVSHDRRPPPDPPVDPQTGASYAPIWDVAECCWKKEPGQRLHMVFVLFRLRSIREDRQV
ncbi:hypothetical protein FRB99_000826 [Tulasnella sp. 403]|nr:hypothetical protein FRB99_000826 [Tulasnella sp. 403]